MVPEERVTSTPAEQVAGLYEQAETAAAKATERLVASGGFVALLGQMAENAAALTKLGNDAMDLVLRNLRVAGRRDVVRLARQLSRSEDKLERVLEELEEVHDQLRQLKEPPKQRGSGSTSARGGGSSSRGSRNGGGNTRRRASS